MPRSLRPCIKIEPGFMDVIRLPAQLPSIKKAQSFIKKCLPSGALASGLATRVALILDEVLVNIVRYAYPQVHTGEFEVCCWADEAGLIWLEVRDWGVPFNPLERERPDPSLDLSSRRMGGWGIEIIRLMTDEVTYQHLLDANILTLRFINQARP